MRIASLLLIGFGFASAAEPGDRELWMVTHTAEGYQVQVLYQFPGGASTEPVPSSGTPRATDDVLSALGDLVDFWAKDLPAVQRNALAAAYLAASKATRPLLVAKETTRESLAGARNDWLPFFNKLDTYLAPHSGKWSDSVWQEAYRIIADGLAEAPASAPPVAVPDKPMRATPKTVNKTVSKPIAASKRNPPVQKSPARTTATFAAPPQRITVGGKSYRYIGSIVRWR